MKNKTTNSEAGMNHSLESFQTRGESVHKIRLELFHLNKIKQERCNIYL